MSASSIEKIEKEVEYIGISDDIVIKLKTICEKSIEDNNVLNCEELISLNIDYESAYSLRQQIYSIKIKKTSSKIRSLFENKYLKLWYLGGKGNDIISLARHARYNTISVSPLFRLSLLLYIIISENFIFKKYLNSSEKKN